MRRFCFQMVCHSSQLADERRIIIYRANHLSLFVNAEELIDSNEQVLEATPIQL